MMRLAWVTGFAAAAAFVTMVVGIVGGDSFVAIGFGLSAVGFSLASRDAIRTARLPRWSVRVDDIDQAGPHTYLVAAESEQAARRFAARRAIVDDPRGCGLDGGWAYRRKHARSPDIVDAVARYAVAERWA